MPIYVSWDETDSREKNLLRWTFDGRWTWSELVQLAIRSRTMVEAFSPREIDAIITSGPSGYLLPTGNMISEAVRAIDMRAANLRRIYVVSSPGVFTAMVRTLIQTSSISSKLICIVSSEEEAYQIIRSASVES